MSTKLPQCPGLLLDERPSGVLHVVLNTPKTLNSFDDQRYKDLIAAFDYARDSKTVRAVVLSSTGKYFSSGAALSPDRLNRSADSKPAPIAGNWVLKFVDMLIDFPKICVTVVQGPAYGISVTMLGLFDLVYASPTVTFTTPFSTLGICLEGCSSVTFPALLGGPLSTRLLYLAETISIDELVQNSQRMIAEIIPSSSNIQGEVLTKVEKSLEGLSLNSIVASKSLVRSKSVRDRLHQVNREEMTLVQNCMAGEEHKDAIRRFQEKKKAKKEEQGRKTSGGGSKL